MSTSYHNTTGATGRELARYRQAAETQEQRIEALFRRYRRPLSPSEVLRLGDFKAPITSIRRAMTNLTSDGVLEKTARKVRGSFGRHEYCWQLREPRQEALL